MFVFYRNVHQDLNAINAKGKYEIFTTRWLHNLMSIGQAWTH